MKFLFLKNIRQSYYFDPVFGLCVNFSISDAIQMVFIKK